MKAWTITVLGWAVSIVAVCCYRGRRSVDLYVFAAFCAPRTLVLLRNRTSPGRLPALRNSWIGPAVFAAGVWMDRAVDARLSAPGFTAQSGMRIVDLSSLGRAVPPTLLMVGWFRW